MTPHEITASSQQPHDQPPSTDDAFLSQFDDAALEHALKTVHWCPQDVSQFLRRAAGV
jgi:hypothetical protein